MMNRQKLACLGLVLSIFVLPGTARAQTARAQARARQAQDRAQALLPPAAAAERTGAIEAAASPGSAPEQTEIPLGTYTSAFPAFVRSSQGYPYGGEFDLTLLAGGRYRVVRNAFIDDSGTYTVTAEQIQFTNPLYSNNCRASSYRWQLQGNRLTLTPLVDSCEFRRIQLSSNPFFRRDPAARVWRQIGPEGGQINALLTVNNALYAATGGGGVYRSTDNGQTWTPSLGIAGYATLALTSFNGNLLAGVNFGQIFISTDGGESWEFTNVGGVNGADIRDFAAVGPNLFAATEGGGVLISTTGGRSWARTASAGLTNQSVNALAVSGTTLFAGTAGGVFRSTNNGQSWTAVNAGLSITNIAALTVSGTRLLAGTGADGGPNEVFVSDNNGDTWRVFGNGLASLTGGGAGADTACYKLMVNGDRLLATARGGLLINEAGAWRRVAVAGPVNELHGIVVSGNQLFVGSLYYGVYRSADNGQSWNAANTGLRARTLWAVLKDKGVLYAGTQDGLLASADEGRNWTRANLGALTGVNALLSDNTRLYAGSDDGVFVSTNGQIWTRGAGLDSAVSVLAASGTTLFAATFEDGVFRSTDGGATWTAANNGLTNKNVFGLTVQGANLFAGTDGGGVFRSTDGGATWTTANAGLPRDSQGALYVFALAAQGANLFAGVIDEGLYRSADNGQTWTRADRGLSPPFVYLLYAGGGNLYASGDVAMGCFRTANNGQDWAPYNNGLDGRFINSFFVSGATLYAASTGGGLSVSDTLVNRAATVSAASFSPTAIADKAIVAAFGPTLAPRTEAASSVPLPVALAGTSVRVRDANGVERLAPLFFVSAGQVNYQIPAGTATGAATITITNADGSNTIGATGEFNVLASAPAIFTATANGLGAAIAVDALTGAAGPFNAKQANGQPNILSIFGTGLGADATDVDGDVSANVTASIGGQAAQVLYAGRTPGLVGLNQFNVALPANITAGTHTLTITRGGVTSNSVTLTIR